jgi:HEAT repeat protein
LLTINNDWHADHVPALINALRSSDGSIKFAAATWLGRVGQAAIPSLLEALKLDDASVRSYACTALGNMGRTAAPAVPDLIAAVEMDPIAGTRGAAADALGRIGDPSALPVLHSACEDRDLYVRQKARASVAAITGEVPRRTSRRWVWLAGPVVGLLVLCWLVIRALRLRRGVREGERSRVG